jgi:flagellin
MEVVIMRINHNVAAINTYSRLTAANEAQSKSLEKLSSGMRINKAGDDAAGLAISEKMRGQIRGLDQASRNAQDGISLIQTAEGALNETHSMLQRMRELVVQANNDTNNADDRNAIQKEITELNNEINRIAEKTTFNTKNLLDGSLGVKVDTNAGDYANFAAAGIDVNIVGVQAGTTISISVDDANDQIKVTVGGTSQILSAGGETSVIAANTTLNFSDVGVTLHFSSTTNLSGGTTNYDELATVGSSANFQIGPNESTVLAININSMKATDIGDALGSGGLASVSAVDVGVKTFDQNIKTIDQAIKDVSDQRAQLGAWQNRLDHTISNLTASSENLTAAESRVRDVDMAKEMMEFTKNNILNQAATAMLAQANQQPQGVLQLLR